MFSARTNLSMYSHIWTFVLVLTILQCNPSAYNINPRNLQIFSDPMATSPSRRGSYFGFSVALYAGAGGPLVLVGAPRANSTALQDVKEPGTVFKCLINGVCEEWLIDKSVNGLFPRDKRINQVKDNAWIGANIAVENKTAARVVVCCLSSALIILRVYRVSRNNRIFDFFAFHKIICTFMVDCFNLLGKNPI